jgi:hypothetical protein
MIDTIAHWVTAVSGAVAIVYGLFQVAKKVRECLREEPVEMPYVL